MIPNVVTCHDRDLTQHFRLYEFLRSQKAAELDIDNTPDEQQLLNLRWNAQNMELVRAELGNVRIDVSSGLRVLPLNRAIGSKDTGDHPKGLATDFTAPDFGSPLAICRRLYASKLPFKQLIYEHGTGAVWVHISWELPGIAAKREVLTLLAGGGYGRGLIPQGDDGRGLV